MRLNFNYNYFGSAEEKTEWCSTTNSQVSMNPIEKCVPRYTPSNMAFSIKAETPETTD